MIFSNRSVSRGARSSCNGLVHILSPLCGGANTWLAGYRRPERRRRGWAGSGVSAQLRARHHVVWARHRAVCPVNLIACGGIAHAADARCTASWVRPSGNRGCLRAAVHRYRQGCAANSTRAEGNRPIRVRVPEQRPPFAPRTATRLLSWRPGDADQA
jgi:hypothetical protein